MFLLVQLISIYINCIRDTMIVAIVYSATKGICDYIYMLYVICIYDIIKDMGGTTKQTYCIFLQVGNRQKTASR